MAPKAELWAPELLTERLRLTLWDMKDPAQNDHILDMVNDPVALATMGDFGIRTHEDIHKLMSKRALPPSIRGPNEIGTCSYLIHQGHSADSPVVGMVNLWQGGKAPSPDMGWSMKHQHAGQGFASEAAKRVLTYWHDELGIEDIAATTDLENVASINIAKKLGFVLNGVNMGHFGKPENVFTLPSTKKYSPEELRAFFEG